MGVLGLVAVAILTLGQRPPEPVAWARLDTQDVHSLAFVNDDPQNLWFGHHGGLLATTDGGRTWDPLPVRSDAMSTSAASDGSVVIAGHEVFLASRDSGSTWTPISTDLPSLDIHGFTRDPGDPNRMWAYLAIGGLWESKDFGATWVRVREDNVLFPVAVRMGSSVRLFGVDTSGFVTSDDGGRTWGVIGAPEAYPLTALTATPDGRTVYAGSTDRLLRSDDGGRSWTRTGYAGSVLALATTSDGASVAVVSQETQYFRSGDRGTTWPGP